MPDLIAKSALDGRTITLANTTLAEAALGPLTSIAPFPGQTDATGAVLGHAFPRPNTTSGPLIWTGRDQAFLLGTPPDLTGLAATTDQTGGWCALRLTGPHAEDALARLVPLDLRPAKFPSGTCARTALNHMAAIVVRDAEGFLILAFRSMAETAWHDLETALHALAARTGV